MKLIYINKQELNEFVGRQEPCQFLQSWDWSEFQEQAGNKVFRLGIEDNNKLIASAVIVKKSILGFKYFYCPRGPVANVKSLDFLFKKIKELAKEEKAKFFRFDPVTLFDSQAVQTIDVQPKKTLILDLTKSEQELLSSMHQKTRYNIRLAEKKGVEISEYNGEWNEVWKIMQQTKARDKFSLHNQEYYRKMADNKMVKVFLARYKGQIIGFSFAVFFKNCATYLHGGSSNEHRNVMAPYLLQLHMIKYAKKLNIKYYDFYGIDEKKWPGVTRFKLGFSGKIVDYPGTFDLILSPVYYVIYRIVRKLRRLC
ncbi:MAG: peptidoglycan bridge formation glycyltransferase FemA/FemB family protein [bacterium]